MLPEDERNASISQRQLWSIVISDMLTVDANVRRWFRKTVRLSRKSMLSNVRETLHRAGVLTVSLQTLWIWDLVLTRERRHAMATTALMESLPATDLSLLPVLTANLIEWLY